jgi:hypothetical protein
MGLAGAMSESIGIPLQIWSDGTSLNPKKINQPQNFS